MEIGNIVILYICNFLWPVVGTDEGYRVNEVLLEVNILIIMNASKSSFSSNGYSLKSIQI